ncbi:hypothetical protein GF351_01820 [Candidatus Woesearchaeota archaeon]|nr:hypothetical protein [Candidatus Woesearchaeota archaeon]
MDFMIKMPLNDIISKIKEKAGLSEEDINSKIDAKMKQLSGLISKEGAAHIIANELGVKLFEQVSGKLEIKNILAGMRSVETVGKATAVYDIREFSTDKGSGKVGSFMLGDETGSIRVVCWGGMTDSMKDMKEGDVVKIQGGYVKENQNRKEVHLNDKSRVILNPPGESVGKVKKVTSVRKKISELRENDSNAEILGTIVQVFEPRFFEICPKCNKRARPDGEKFACSEHGEVIPNYGCVINCNIDDGTENIRAVFFRQQAERLLGKTSEEMLKYKDDPAAFEAVKNDLLGTIVKLVGKVNKNDMFERMDFIANLVFLNPDPGEEIKNLEGESSKSSGETAEQATSGAAAQDKPAEEQQAEEKPAESPAKTPEQTEPQPPQQREEPSPQQETTTQTAPK